LGDRQVELVAPRPTGEVGREGPVCEEGREVAKGQAGSTNTTRCDALPVSPIGIEILRGERVREGGWGEVEGLHLLKKTSPIEDLVGAGVRVGAEVSTDKGCTIVTGEHGALSRSALRQSIYPQGGVERPDVVLRARSCGKRFGPPMPAGQAFKGLVSGRVQWVLRPARADADPI